MKKKIMVAAFALISVMLFTGCDGDSNSTYGDSGGYSNNKSNSKEEYYCMGKGDTCPNKTHDPFDFYCYSCDPDGNNIEGDQRK